jgi:hypothetical protein
MPSKPNWKIDRSLGYPRIISPDGYVLPCVSNIHEEWTRDYHEFTAKIQFLFPLDSEQITAELYVA